MKISKILLMTLAFVFTMSFTSCTSTSIEEIEQEELLRHDRPQNIDKDEIKPEDV